ncbi:RNA pseudouridine synthase 4, mitochondrial [Magnolia sinica]|uniref:RNA pseudouridine synthase 4, mitochondrial n=1 Tax=Magnolia sinica TaxID=86752 RepID=UPI00265AE3D5|nr:RNA pseudouridine synthase 4, mitochondrial [Magnolia sinica]
MKMAEKGLSSLLRRPSLYSLTTATAVKAVYISIFSKFPSSSYSSAAAAAFKEAAEGEEREDIKKEKGKWLTLPPFSSSSVDASLLGKRIFGRHPSDSKETEVDAAATMTALKWVLRCCPQLPRCLVQKLFRLRQVRRESSNATAACLESQVQQHRLTRVSAKDAMNSGDRIFLPITVQEYPSEKNDYLCNEDEINYIQSLELYKDPAIIVVNKPPGLPVQGGIGINKSLDMLAATSLRYDYSEPPRLVHRLDRDSSGILVMGRTQTSATVLHSIFREKTSGASFHAVGNAERILERKYWALVIGTPRRAKGLISAPLAKVVMDNGKSERITIVDDTKITSSQHALTEYEVIKSSNHGYTWLELRPLTGRKHQLRVHCAEALGTPIVGDYKYGWQSHRKLEPMPCFNWERESAKHLTKRKLPFGLDLESGSISEKQPHLHLHCRQMLLPNVSLALQLQSSTHCDLSKLERINLVAPLPSHMQRSWDILSS